MPLNCSKLLEIAFIALALGSGFADVVPISNSQQVHVSGNVFICVFEPFPCGPDSQADGFDSDLGTFGPATVSVPGQGTLLSDASTSGGLSMSTNNISGNLLSSTFIGGPALHIEATASAINQNSLQFDLTSRSIVHLTGLLDFFTNNAGEAVDFSDNAQFSLSGPKFQFEESCGDPIPGHPVHFCPNSFDTLFTLDPGIYTLNAITDSTLTGFSHITDSVSDHMVLSFNADFTAVPEPYWTPLVPVLLVAMCAYVARRNSSR